MTARPYGARPCRTVVIEVLRTSALAAGEW